METFYFKLVGFSLQIQIDWPVYVNEHFKTFLTNGSEYNQERIKIVAVNNFPVVSVPQWVFGRGETMWNGQRCIFRRHTENSPPYLMELYQTDHEQLLCYRNTSNEIPGSMSNIFNDISLEELFLRNEALILHSSFIRWKGLGILFSAPSGTGKSTQADLWAEYEGAEILNGDRAGLRKIDGRWRAFGLPFAGSSDIFRNESAPISTIVMLEQGPENRLTPLTTAQAFRKILPEVSLHRWDARFMDQGISLILELLAATPVYLLSCRPDQGAVELLHDTIIHHPEVKL